MTQTKILDLEAAITLDSNAFATDLSNAVADAQTLATEIDGLNKTPESYGSSLSNVVDDANDLKLNLETAKKEANTTDQKIEDIGTKGGTVLQNLMETFAGIAASLVETVIAGIFELGAQGIELAAAEGGPLADAYNKASKSLSLTQDIAMLEIGNALLPVATAFKQMVDGILSFALNIDDADRLLAYLDQLETYEADNLKQVAENIKGIFTAFSEVKRADPVTVEDLQKGVTSQTQYWEDYASVMQSLSDKGVDSSLLADIATGTVESLAQLQALDAAAPDALQSLIDSMKELDAAESTAAEAINTAQVDVALSTDNVNATIADMVSRLNKSEMAKLNMGKTMDSVVESIGTRIPALRSQVQTIQALVAELVAVPTVPFGFSNTTFGSAFTGWNMVKPETQTESGRGGFNSLIDYSALESVLLSALRQWLAPVGTSEVVGIVSNGIAQSMRGRR